MIYLFLILVIAFILIADRRSIPDAEEEGMTEMEYLSIMDDD